jgi:peptide/nickel transport system substrate-binding protein
MAGTVVDTMLSGVAGATGPGIGSGTPVRGGTLNIGLASDAPNAYTFTGATGKLDDAGFNVAIAVFDSLFLTSANGQTILPNLGTSIVGSTGPNGPYTYWTVALRSGISFHDGTAFDADAVVTNYTQAAANATVGSAINPLIKDCTKIDSMTVRYETLLPFYNFPHIMSESQIAYMASPAMFENAWISAKKLPSGTGPFKSSAWSIGHFSSWVKNPTYWRKDASGNALPYLNEVYFKTIVDPSTRLTALKTNSINVGIFSDGVSIKAIEKGLTSVGKKCVYTTSVGQSIIQPAMNCVLCNTTGKDLFGATGSQEVNSSGTWKPGPVSPIADQRIRHALALAINTKGYLSGIDQNVGAVSNGIFTTGSSFYANPGYPVYSPASVTAGKALVAAYKASNSLSKTAKVTIHMQIVSGSKTASDQFAYISKCAAAVGITLVAVPVVQSILIGNAIGRTYEMSAWAQFGGVVQDGNYVWWDSSKLANGGYAPGFPHYPGPASAGGVNFANNVDGAVETAMVSALAASTPAGQKAQWQAVNARFSQDFPYLWLDETVVVWAAQATVQNWANAMAPTATSSKSTTPVLGPSSGVLGWAQIWIS